MATRDEIRAKALATHQPDKHMVTFFGAEIELRQPKLKDILAAQVEAAEKKDDGRSAVVKTLIQYAYVPGTDEKVFEDADEDALMEQPFGQDFVNLSEAITKLTSVDFGAKKPV